MAFLLYTTCAELPFLSASHRPMLTTAPQRSAVIWQLISGHSCRPPQLPPVAASRVVTA